MRNKLWVSDISRDLGLRSVSGRYLILHSSLVAFEATFYKRKWQMNFNAWGWADIRKYNGWGKCLWDLYIWVLTCVSAMTGDFHMSDPDGESQLDLPPRFDLTIVCRRRRSSVTIHCPACFPVTAHSRKCTALGGWTEQGKVYITCERQQNVSHAHSQLFGSLRDYFKKTGNKTYLWISRSSSVRHSHLVILKHR